MAQAASGRPGEASRERILRAAHELVADRGLAGVTLREIAARAGLHNSSLFHHFPGKLEIVRAAFEGVLERVLPLLEPLGADDPPSLDVFVDTLETVAAYFHDAPEDARFLLRAILDAETILGDYRSLDRSRGDHPVVRLFSLVWGWLGRARAAGAVRDHNVYQATRNLFGLMLFEPTYGFEEPGARPDASEHAKRRRYRCREVRAFVRGGLAPEGGQP